MILPLQEHVLSYGMYLCIAGICSKYMLTQFIYLLHICSSLLIVKVFYNKMFLQQQSARLKI